LFNASLFSNQPFQRGSRIIEIGQVFATSFSTFGGPFFMMLRIVEKNSSQRPFSKRKQLYRVRIDDHIKQNLNLLNQLLPNNIAFFNCEIVPQKQCTWEKP